MAVEVLSKQPLQCRLTIDQTWDGKSIPQHQQSVVVCSLSEDKLNISVDAPFYDQDPPPEPPGRLDGLWNYEVVECFLVGDSGRYLELEFGPYGHWLGLVLVEPRQRLRDDVEIKVESLERRESGRWRGSYQVDRGPKKEPSQRLQ